MPQVLSPRSRLRTSLLLATMSVALAACGGGGGGGAAAPAPGPVEPPVGAPSPSPTPSPSPSPSPSPAPSPTPAPPPVASNTRPTAVISPVANGQVTGQAITITARSVDPDAGQTLTHTWALTGRPNGSSAALSSGTGASITLTPDVAGNYTLRLLSNDGLLESAPATLTFSVIAANSPPSVSITGVTPASPRAGQTVTVTALGTDPDNLPVTYAWNFVSTPPGFSGPLSGSGTGNPVTFWPTVDGTYRVRVVASDGVLSSPAVERDINVAINQRPTAVIAGCPSSPIVAGTTVSLQSTGSSDPEGSALTYQWSIASAPTGSTSTLLPSATASSITFRPTTPTPVGDTYRLDLTVNDGLNPSAVAASCSFAVNGNPVPNAVIAVLNGSSLVSPGDQVASAPSLPALTLRADSTDNDPLTHTWRLISGGGSLSASTGASVSFTPPAAGTYVFGLVSNDGLNPSTEATRSVTVSAPPVVSFTVNGQALSSLPVIRAGEAVTLASTSTDPEGNVLTQSWTLTSPVGAPAVGEPAIPTSGSLSNLSFVTSASVPGNYVVRLTASDGVNPAVQSAPVTLTVQAQAGPVACSNPTGFLQGTRFAVPTGAAAGTVSVGGTGSSPGNSACFQRTVYEGIVGNDTISQGSFQYFEVVRNESPTESTSISVGVAASDAPMSRVLATGDWPVTTRAVYVQGGSTVFGSSRTFDMLGTDGSNPNPPYQNYQTTFGIAVDYRERYPVVSVIGKPDPGRFATLPAHCLLTTPATSPAAVKPYCVLSRNVLNTTAPVRIYAFGREGGKVTINGGESSPYAINALSRREALRSRVLDGDRGLNPQLFVAGAASLPTPTISRAATSPWRTVILADTVSPTPGLRTELSVVTGGSVRWLSASGAVLGTGPTLNLVAARAALVGSATLPTGGTTFRIEAVASEAGNDDTGPAGRAAMTASVPFWVTIGPATDASFDHDGDGLSFTAELANGTDPADGDTDRDGIPDDVDSTVLAAVTRTVLARELLDAVQSTAQGVRVADDGLSVAFTDELNPACLENPPLGDAEICNKRGIRANVGVPVGQFRYFEITNLMWTPTNSADTARR